MARKITPTPILEGKDTVKFLLEMNEPPGEEKKKMLDGIKKKHKPLF